MTSHARALAERLASELRTLVRDRLRALVVFGSHAADASVGDGAPVHTLAVLRGLSVRDLEGLAARCAGWRREGLATPLVIGEHEFARSLDAFPIEFGAVMANYEVVTGDDPFTGLSIDAADLRRACEVQVRSHLLHLREGYLEAGGSPAAIGHLVTSSAAPLRSLLANVARLTGDPAHAVEALAARGAHLTGSPAGVFRDVLARTVPGTPAGDTARLFPEYLEAVERLAAVVDDWTQPA
jgi:hypothetical protein